MNGPEWLRSQLTSFTCPACRRHYQAGSIRLLAERDGLFFVDLDCMVCNSHTVAIVTIGSDDAEAAIAEVPLASDIHELVESPPSGLPGTPVSADDVLEMHEFLAAFTGDVEQMFRAAARQAGGAERR